MGIKRPKRMTETLPGETVDPNPRATIGNNEPPIEERIPLEFREALIELEADFFKVLETYVGVTDAETGEHKNGQVDIAKCANDVQLGKCGEVVNTLRKLGQRVEAAHKQVKEPYLLGGRLVDAERRALMSRIEDGGNRVQGLMNKYAADKREEERKARVKAEEERCRLEELARENNLEAALPPVEAAPPVKTEPVRSLGGATVSVSTEWQSEVTDYAKAFKHVKNDAKVREAIDAAIKRLVKATKGNNGKELAGVIMREGVKAGAR